MQTYLYLILKKLQVRFSFYSKMRKLFFFQLASLTFLNKKIEISKKIHASQRQKTLELFSTNALNEVLTLYLKIKL